MCIIKNIPSRGLEPRMSDPNSEVLPITLQGITKTPRAGHDPATF